MEIKTDERAFQRHQTCVIYTLTSHSTGLANISIEVKRKKDFDDRSTYQTIGYYNSKQLFESQMKMTHYDLL